MKLGIPFRDAIEMSYSEWVLLLVSQEEDEDGKVRGEVVRDATRSDISKFVMG